MSVGSALWTPQLCGARKYGHATVRQLKQKYVCLSFREHRKINQLLATLNCALPTTAPHAGLMAHPARTRAQAAATNT